MAPPDLNALTSRSPIPASHTTTSGGSQQGSTEASRRTSSVMGPPPIPTHSSLPNSPRPQTANVVDNPAATSGPIRHPRPLTAAELHLELEKEQESIVNRLTRELSALRAQTASVASTASSTSDLFYSQTLPEYPYPYAYQPGAGASIIPTSARRHRSSSNLSARSARSARDGTLSASVPSSAAAAARDRDIAATSVSGVAAPRESYSHQASSRPSTEISRERPNMSRQNSLSAIGGGHRSASSTTSPYLGQHSSSFAAYGPTSHSQGHPHRTSVGSATNTSQGMEARSPSFGSAIAAARYEEAALQRAELESVKRENEALRQRIKDLEKLIIQSPTDPPQSAQAASQLDSTVASP